MLSWRPGSVEPCIQGHISAIAVKPNTPAVRASSTTSVSYSMEHSPSWEANRLSANQEFPRNVLNPKFPLPHSHMPATCPYPDQARSSPYPTSHFLKIHPYIKSPSTPGSSKWPFPSEFPTKTLYTPLPYPHTFYMPYPSHSARFDHPNIWWGVQIMKFLIMYFFPLQSYFVPVGPDILLNILSPDNLSLSSSLSVSDQVSHP
jgi:hypothetical protein